MAVSDKTPKTKVQSLDIARSDETLHLATDLAKFIKDNKLSTSVQGKEFVNVEGWQYAGSRLGIVPIVDHVINVGSDVELKYQAKVTLFDLRSHHTVGAGFACCSNKENGKKFYQEFAIMSMAQTRAIGKAYRNILAWIIRAAGYEPTPAEEMEYAGNLPEASAAPESGKPVEEPAPTMRALGAPEASAAPEPNISDEELAALEEKAKKPTGLEGKVMNPQGGITVDNNRYATPGQKDEIIKLLNHPMITRQEKTKVLLGINQLNQDQGTRSINKLKKMIDDRELERSGADLPDEDQLAEIARQRDEAAQELYFVEANHKALGKPEYNRLMEVCMNKALTADQVRKEQKLAQEQIGGSAAA